MNISKPPDYPIQAWQPTINALLACGIEVKIDDPTERDPTMFLTAMNEIGRERLKKCSTGYFLRGGEGRVRSRASTIARIFNITDQTFEWPDDRLSAPAVDCSHMMALLREAMVNGTAISIQDSEERNPDALRRRQGESEPTSSSLYREL
ncbi:MAG TPA: hypothetical protein VJB60_00800 [Candidatus Peribacterales bacterium]|nr:hypothetical protein [Candidatus Peribacterales bacterium]